MSADAVGAGRASPSPALLRLTAMVVGLVLVLVPAITSFNDGGILDFAVGAIFVAGALGLPLTLVGFSASREGSATPAAPFLLAYRVLTAAMLLAAIVFLVRRESEGDLALRHCVDSPRLRASHEGNRCAGRGPTGTGCDHRVRRRPFLKLFGIGLAVAILLDATVVRMVLVPAAPVAAIAAVHGCRWTKWLQRAAGELLSPSAFSVRPRNGSRSRSTSGPRYERNAGRSVTAATMTIRTAMDAERATPYM